MVPMTFEEWWKKNTNVTADTHCFASGESIKKWMSLSWQAATAAERERCAKVAEYGELDLGVHPCANHTRVIWDSRRAIAAAIRGQDGT